MRGVPHPEPGRTRCRAAGTSPADGAGFLVVVLLALVTGGYLATTQYINSRSVAARFHEHASAQFGLWATLLGVVGGFAAAAAWYFIVAFIGIGRLSAQSSRRSTGIALGSVLAVFVIVFTVLFRGTATAPDSLDKKLAESTQPITVAVALCMIPGLMGFVLVRAIARRPADWDESSQCRFRLIIRLRHEAQRLLGVLGSFLTILVASVGLRRRALLVADPRADSPVEGVVLYGLLFATILGLFFVAANRAIDDRAGRLLDDYAAIPAGESPTLTDEVARRGQLSDLLGLGGSWRTFQSSVLVAAPLLSGLIGSALSGA